MGNIKNKLRSFLNFSDQIGLYYYLFWLTLGYKMWGVDYRVRKISKAPSRYLIGILTKLGAAVASTTTFKGGLTFDNIGDGLSGLQIEENSYIGPGVFLDLASSITIEPEVVLSPQVLLLTHGDVGDRFLAQYIKRSVGPILLKKGCWIGARAVILPGVTIGTGAVVGAGAVVTHDIPDFTMVAGIPAREIKKVK